MFVAVGKTATKPAETGWAEEAHPLRSAYDWLGFWWDNAEEVPKPVFEKRSLAVDRADGRPVSILQREFDRGRWWYIILREGRKIRVAERTLRDPESVGDPSVWIQQPPESASRFAATLTRAKLRAQLTDTVYSFRATKTIFRAYQFRPVIRLLEAGQLRLLIADEVGLGKTIEAGLVWTELDARQQADRVLVVCPSMLVPKWLAEMRERFDYQMLELDRPRLDQMLEEIEQDRWPRRFSGICSLERLRVWPGLERIAELAPRFDLIIVDEAHAFRNRQTKNHALGALLEDWADALIFLSATPLNLGNEDLFSLLQLLAPGEFDDRYVLEQRLEPNAVLHSLSASLLNRNITNADRIRILKEVESLDFGPTVADRPEYRELISLLGGDALVPAEIAKAKRLIGQLHALSAVVTRTRKVEAQDEKAVREAIKIPVYRTEAEAEFYRAFEHWQFDRARVLGLSPGFVTQMPRRLASTCLPAARDQVLSWGEGSWEEELEDFDIDLEGGDEDWEGVGNTDLWELPPPAEVVDLARNLGDVDTKFDAFIKGLRPIVDEGRRVIVFTFSRRALQYLFDSMREDFRIEVMHGDVDRDTRHDIMRRFRNHDFDILLASRVASEGLDFEFCSAVVNYDLPWNPMEVEQRIGRIDRFGQTAEKIKVLNFHTPGTIETDIIERVHERIGVFKDSIGELEPILQSEYSDIRRTIGDFSLTEEERQRRLDEKMTAIEEQQLAADDVEAATSYLSSTDTAEIDGLEDDLRTTGRYIGQPELVHLLRDWAQHTPGAYCRVNNSGTHVTFRGVAAMESQLLELQDAGERSRAEVDQLARAVRDERELVMCLDPEQARTTGQQLLSANSPLVRAALKVPGSIQVRFGNVGVRSSTVAPGLYLVLVAVARWVGLRPSVEFWTEAVELESGSVTNEDVGSAILAALAESRLEEREAPMEAEFVSCLREAERALNRRQEEEDDRRQAMNDLLVETRRISLRQTHDRKVEQIDRRIATLREKGHTGMIRPTMAQRSKQDRRLRDAEEQLEERSHGRMEVEPIAVCVAQVIPE